MAPFWCEEGFIPKDYYRHGESISSLVEAAGSGSIDVFEMLLNHGADSSFWMRPQFYVPHPATESSLCVWSPLHAAIQNGQTGMLEHLLGLGFDPNTMPLVNPTRCFTPLVATFIHTNEFNKKAFDILASQPSINFDIRTPIYDVHLLHFAVAKLDLAMLKHISSKVPLKNAGVTALGHTLLHIACLPADSTEVQRLSQKIALTIHETRGLHTGPDLSADPIACHIQSYEDGYLPLPRLRIQNQVIKFLWNNGIRDIEKKDIHGNTALHYLASYKIVNMGIIDWLFDQDESVEQVWNGSGSQSHVSPRELADQGVSVSSTISWEPWFDRKWTNERVKKKQEIWKGLLGKEQSRNWAER